MVLLRHLISQHIARTGEGAVRNYALDGAGEAISRRHEHRSRAHGYAVQPEPAAEIGLRALHPAAYIIALARAEADLPALTLPMRALVHEQHAEAAGYVILRNSRKIVLPARAVAVDEDDIVFPIPAQQPRVQTQAVKGIRIHILPGKLAQLEDKARDSLRVRRPARALRDAHLREFRGLARAHVDLQ